MRKKDLKKLAEDSKFIPGIYNYCDRWCERCQFTSRCLNHTLGEEQFGDLHALDLNNAAFWEKLRETLNETISMLSEIAEAHGIDLDSMEIETDSKNKGHRESKQAVHIVSHISKTYVDMVDTWFDSCKFLLEQKEDELDKNSGPKLVPFESIHNAVTLQDSLEVIRWYQHQIYVKIARAIKSRDNEDSMDFHDYPKDSDGSAKVALIGIDRSISAWWELLKHFSTQKDAILKMTLYLNRIRKMMEREFPDARAFVRPGFDEIKKVAE
jgi:hypothetical protein